MSASFDPKISSIYPQLPPRRKDEGVVSDEEIAGKVKDWVGESDIFSTLPTDTYDNEPEGTPSAYEEVEGYTRPPAYSPESYSDEGYTPPPACSPDAYVPEEMPAAYVPVSYETENQETSEYPQYIPVEEHYDPIQNTSLIDYSNPLERLTEEPSLSEKMGQTVTDTAVAIETAAGAVAEAAALAGPAVATAATALGAATVAVGKPIGKFAFGLLRGAGSLLWGAATGSFREDPAVARHRRELQDRVDILYAQYIDIECDQKEYENRELAMIVTPALTGLVFGGIPGAIVSGALGFLSGKVCRAISRTFPQYAAKAAQSAQIQAEIRDLSARLGQKAPHMRRLFQ